MHSQAFPVQEQVDITFNFNGSTKVKLPVMAVPSGTVYNFLQLNKNYRTVAASAALLGNLSQRLSSSNMLPNSAILSLTVANNRDWVNLQNGSLTFEYVVLLLFNLFTLLIKHHFCFLLELNTVPTLFLAIVHCAHFGLYPLTSGPKTAANLTKSVLIASGAPVNATI